MEFISVSQEVCPVLSHLAEFVIQLELFDAMSGSQQIVPVQQLINKLAVLPVRLEALPTFVLVFNIEIYLQFRVRLFVALYNST